jgi:hypothetical protein
MSGKARRMGAALPGYISKDNGANPNMIQYGDKLQGLASVTNIRSGVTRHIKTRAWGSTRDRHRIFCINQLGGVGNVKNSQFAPNADGVMECHNRKNTRDKWDGIYHRSFGESQLLSSTQHDVAHAASYGAWNFMASNDFLVEEVLSSLPTGNITGAYFNSFRCLYSDWDSSSSTAKGEVNCDGEIVDAPDSKVCTDVQRMSNFFYNSEAEAYTKDLYLGFSQSNYIEGIQPQASSTQYKATLGKNLQHLGYDSDKMIVWFCFGGDAAPQALNPDTGNGSTNNIKDIVDGNNDTLSGVTINNKSMPYIKGLNFDVEGGILTAARQNYDYFNGLLTYLHNNPPDSGKIEYIQFTILVGNAGQVPEFQTINNALANHHSNFKFRISFMPYANGSIITNCEQCGNGPQGQDGCVCYYANTLAGANMLIDGSTRCKGIDCSTPQTEAYRDASGKAFACCNVIDQVFDYILGGSLGANDGCWDLGEGKLACCPEGYEPYGNGSACQKKDDPTQQCSLNESNVPPLNCCGPPAEGSNGTWPLPCTDKRCWNLGEDKWACCPEGYEPYGNGSACQKKDDPTQQCSLNESNVPPLNCCGPAEEEWASPPDCTPPGPGPDPGPGAE